MRYRIFGAFRATAESVQLVLEADNIEGARDIASDRGVLVVEIIPIEPSEPDKITPVAHDSSEAPLAGMPRQRIVLAFTAGIGMLATFMPWVKAPIIGSVAGTAGDGWITFVLFAASLGLVFTGQRDRILAGGRRLSVVTPALLAALLGVWKIIDLGMRKNEMRADDSPFAEALSLSVQVGFGLYAVVAAGIAISIIAFAIKR